MLRRLILDLMTRFQNPLGRTQRQLRTSAVHSASGCGNSSAMTSSRFEGESCEVTELGRAFIRNVCMAFDARLARRAPNAQLFSTHRVSTCLS